MKSNIVKLRMLGMTAFLLYILSVMFLSSKNYGFYFTQIQQLLIIISFGSFAIVLGLQLYRVYIKNFVKEEEEDL
jgi:hypothetical protein